MTGTDVDGLRAAGAFFDGADTGGGGGGGGVTSFFTGAGLGCFLINEISQIKNGCEKKNSMYDFSKG